MTRYLVTSALPYANGPIHLGHVIGAYLPADVYVRALRLRGEDVVFVSGSDEYGAAITIGAQRARESCAEYVAHWRDSIKSTFDALGIEFDIWSGTSVCPEHAGNAQEFFRRLDANGYLEQRHSEQWYSEEESMFLADRYVVGTCYVCGAADARGDECPSCGTWLEAVKLGDARSALSDRPLVLRETTHWYLDLPKLRDEHIGEWFRDHEWKANVRAFVTELLENLPARAITRDLDWGIPVPAELAGDEVGKVLYVWFDAPIGYVSFTQQWARERGTPEAWRDYWQGEDTRLVHFLGKDNIPFHCLVFPSMLYGVKQNFVLPWAAPAMEFYNLQGGKFSTSEQRTIPLEPFFERFDRDATRFYLLASAPETADSEFRFQEFQSIVNAGLADKIGNLTTRVLRFVAKHEDGVIPPITPEHTADLDELLFTGCGEIVDPIDSLLAHRFRRAAEELLANATVANVFVDRTAPWALRKTDPERMRGVLRTACEWLAWMARWMSPFMPDKAAELWTMLGLEGAPEAARWPQRPERGAWRQLGDDRHLGEIRGLFDKLDDATIAEETAKYARPANGELPGQG
ncbi:MAG: methionine--tRNA ligase [Planctomycetota bacterium]